jgi:hypothetical protein
VSEVDRHPAICSIERIETELPSKQKRPPTEVAYSSRLSSFNVIARSVATSRTPRWASFRVCFTPRVSQKGSESTRKTIIPTGWLKEKITVGEADAKYPGVGDDRASRFPEATRPFGFLNRQWETLKAEIKPSDELWTFCSPADSWRQFTGLMGVALLRDGKVIEVIVTEMN